MKGHTGKILKVDLTNGKVEQIPTKKYEEWVGGIGMGIAVFWDEIDKDYLANSSNTTGFEADNVICLMPGVLAGTLSPSGGRTEVCGIAPESYPRPQFSRSNFGGRFAPMLKFAGWDGVVIKGKANKPVWLDIRDNDVQIRDASSLWGLGTFATQEEIWQEINSKHYQDWYQVGTNGSRKSTQRPAVVTIGQAGENLARIGCLIHDAGNGGGQGGFGGVFGSKNLKAISVIGSDSVAVADPQALLETRKWHSQFFFDFDNPWGEIYGCSNLQDGGPPSHGHLYGHGASPEDYGRPLGCYACTHICRQNLKNGGEYPGGESECVEAIFYAAQDTKKHGKGTYAGYLATQLLQDYGINAYGVDIDWVESLYERGLLGKGKRIDTDLDMEQLGTEQFARDFLRKIAYREDMFGNDSADGLTHAAAKWGVLEEDLMSGVLERVYNIGELHWGNQVDWAYESLFSVRDINQHDGLYEFQWPATQKPEVSAERVAKRIAEIGAPFYDELMADRSEKNIYSIHMANYVAWHRRLCKFWKNSAQFCDWSYPSMFHLKNSDEKGISPEVETRYFNAVTGANLTWEDGLEIGRKIWNFERAILVMEGRHRSEEYFPPFPPYTSFIYTEEAPFIQKGRQYPVYEGGKWEYQILNFPMRKDKMDEFKTIYYELEGWDKSSGWPTRKTLEECGLKLVADELASRRKLP